MSGRAVRGERGAIGRVRRVGRRGIASIRRSVCASGEETSPSASPTPTRITCLPATARWASLALSHTQATAQARLLDASSSPPTQLAGRRYARPSRQIVVWALPSGLSRSIRTAAATPDSTRRAERPAVLELSSHVRSRPKQVRRDGFDHGQLLIAMLGYSLTDPSRQLYPTMAPAVDKPDGPTRRVAVLTSGGDSA